MNPSQAETSTTDVQTSGPSVSFTENAARALRQYQQEEDNAELNFRLSIEGGGCAGFMYHLDLVEGQEEDDWVIEKVINEADQSIVLKLLIDPISYTLVNGAEVDYVENIEGKQLVVRNPNAQTTCGCGSSFVPKDE